MSNFFKKKYLLFPLNILAGFLLFYSFPPRNMFWLAYISLILFYISLKYSFSKTSIYYSIFLSFLYGYSYYFFLLTWVGKYVGMLAVIGLALLCCMQIVLATIVIRWGSGNIYLPFWFALSWVIFEYFLTVFPFGGFGWGRIAYTQIGSGLSNLSFLVGVNGVSFITVFLAALISELILFLVNVNIKQLKISISLFSLTTVLLGIGLVFGFKADNFSKSGKKVNVALVQGGVPELGLNVINKRYAVFFNHVKQTRKMLSELQKQEKEKPTIIFWPENASDIDPGKDFLVRNEINNLVEEINIPIVLGTIYHAANNAYFNRYIIYTPRGFDKSINPKHDKHNLQPFGEYMPLRGLFKHFSKYVDMAGSFTPGTDNGVIEINNIKIAVPICYEIIFDDLLDSMWENEPAFMVIPSNNATFGKTNMTFQQLAIGRFRAKEFKTTVLVPTTSGVSALIDNNGRIVKAINIGDSGYIDADITMCNSITPIVYLDRYIKYFFLLVFLSNILFISFRKFKRVS